MKWRNFTGVIEKAITSCRNARIDIGNHFVNVNKMVNLGPGSKSEIAIAQTYFTVQARNQENIEEHIELQS
jgi:DNA-damage-inducible protein D